MQTAAGSTRKQKLIAAGAIIALAILSTQAYAYIASGSLTTGGLAKAGGTTDPPTNSTISVTGNGQVNIQPTIAILSIGVDTQNPSAQTAAQQNANMMANIITALGSLGINNSSIQTVSYNIYQQYPYPVAYAGYPSINSTAISASNYEVDNQIQVTISVASQNVAQLGTKVGAAIDAVVAQGANEIYGVQFTASNSATQLANQQALAAAVQDASGQAKAIASALDVTITGVVSVTTSPLYTPSPIVYNTPAAQVSSQTPVVAPQSLTVTASVQAVYAIS
jgi:uncharacterized protein YggE